MPVMLKYFSEDELFVNAECPFCNRVLKIDKVKLAEIDTGYKINVVVACKCGKPYDTINAKKEPARQPTENQSITPVSQPAYSKSFLVLLAIVLLSCVAVAIFGFTEDSKKPPPVSPTPPTYISLVGRAYNDVGVYYGSGEIKTYAFKIVGATKQICPALGARGLLVEYKDGAQEWKSYEAIVLSGNYYAYYTDPALATTRLTAVSCP